MGISLAAQRLSESLPAEVSPLLGREFDSARLRELLDDPSIRLVTITGPGGVGKTRLALHVASSLGDAFGEAIAFVPLAAIREPALVLPAIAQAFGVFSDPRDAPEDRLVNLLGDEPVLLVLDNLEQVPGAAPRLANVLGRCRRVTMLVTSRAPLGISGEQLYPLAPLPLPAASETSTGAILQTDAVALFVRRARQVAPNLAVDDRTAATIAEICRKVDGLPLAIELAAARTNILSPEALLARLSDRLRVLAGDRRNVPDRQRTMRDAIAWSYELLAREERALFRRMAVFTGGFSIDAVEAIAPAAGSDRDPLDILSALVDHSLVHSDPQPSGGSRFRMLATLRDYGLEQLKESGETDAVYLAHARFVTTLAEESLALPTDERLGMWTARFDPEIGNIRAAAGWTLDNGQPELALRIGGALWAWCANRGLTTECRGWLELALTGTPETLQRTVPHARYGAGSLASLQRDLDTARTHLEAALDHAIDAGSVANTHRALAGLGIVAQDAGDLDAAIAYHERARRVAERGDASAAMVTGDTEAGTVTTSGPGATLQLSYTLLHLALIARVRGELERARELLGEAIATSRAGHHRLTECASLVSLAAVAIDEGELQEAASLVLKSTRLCTEIGERLTLLENAECMSVICTRRGQHAAAVELLTAATRQRAALDSVACMLEVVRSDEIRATARRHLDGTSFAAASQAGHALDLDGMTRRVTDLALEMLGREAPAEVTVPTAPQPAAPPASYRLTRRETEVLRLLADGRSTIEISEIFHISPRTTNTHVRNLLVKLGVGRRTAAIALALREGLV